VASAPSELRPTLSPDTGAPLAGNQHAETAGPGGPLFVQDRHVFEKHRGRVPQYRMFQRVVQARAPPRTAPRLMPRKRPGLRAQ
jgi:catalase